MCISFLQAEDGIRDLVQSRGLGDVYKRQAPRGTSLPALADDSGIEIDGLGGAPGVYTADWAETPNGRDFVMAMTRSWNELEAASASEPRTARFCSTLVLAWPDGHDEVFAGVMAGQIVWPMRGDQGHGYDPIFQPEGYDVTFGEMDRWETDVCGAEQQCRQKENRSSKPKR